LSGPGRSSSQPRQRDPADARDADRLSGRLGQIDDAAMGVRPAVVDAHHHGAARALVRHPNLGAEGQAAVRRRQGVGVEDLAACGSPALEARPIPGGRAALTMPLYLSVPLIVIRIELS